MRGRAAKENEERSENNTLLLASPAVSRYKWMDRRGSAGESRKRLRNWCPHLTLPCQNDDQIADDVVDRQDSDMLLSRSASASVLTRIQIILRLDLRRRVPRPFPPAVTASMASAMRRVGPRGAVALLS